MSQRWLGAGHDSRSTFLFLQEFLIMIRQSAIRTGLFGCALILGMACASAQTTFDFSSLPAGVIDGNPLDNAANMVTVNLTNSSVQATFSDPNASRDFVFTAFGGVAGLTAPVILSDTGGNGTATSDVLDITLSKAINALTFNFALGNGLTGGDTLDASLFNGSTLVGTETFIGNANDTGVFNLDGLSVTGVVLSASTSAANGINYATVNLEPATLAAVPEPSGWTLLGAGLIGIIALRRRQATS